MAAGIYMIVHERTDKKYVGQSQDISRRVRDHLDGWRRGVYTALTADVKKYGEHEFRSEVLETWDVSDAELKAKMDAAERRWILEHDSLLPNGYNERLPGGKETTRINECEFQMALFDVSGTATK